MLISKDTTNSGIAGNSAVRINFAHTNRGDNRPSLAIFDRKAIAHLGGLEIHRNLAGSGKNRRNCRESRDFRAFRSVIILVGMVISEHQQFTFMGSVFEIACEKTLRKYG